MDLLFIATQFLVRASRVALFIIANVFNGELFHVVDDVC